mmetsp:Transcript_3184/g.5108  ORF Transcript_3184/g.5108 Transcript_3184/m.5108 type:complete len:325 (-) Transcript_3184:80-1054(-)
MYRARVEYMFNMKHLSTTRSSVHASYQSVLFQMHIDLYLRPTSSSYISPFFNLQCILFDIAGFGISPALAIRVESCRPPHPLRQSDYHGGYQRGNEHQNHEGEWHISRRRSDNSLLQTIVPMGNPEQTLRATLHLSRQLPKVGLPTQIRLGTKIRVPSIRTEECNLRNFQRVETPAGVGPAPRQPFGPRVLRSERPPRRGDPGIVLERLGATDQGQLRAGRILGVLPSAGRPVVAESFGQRGLGERQRDLVVRFDVDGGGIRRGEVEVREARGVQEAFAVGYGADVSEGSVGVGGGYGGDGGPEALGDDPSGVAGGVPSEFRAG